MSTHTRHIRRALGGTLLAGGLLVVVTQPSASFAAHTPVQHRTLPVTLLFEASVYHGPDTGLTFRGPLRLQVRQPSGVATGVLRTTMTSVTVLGRFQGAAVNLIFTVAGGRHIFGVGSAVYDNGRKKWLIGGPLVGPRPGDAGDWAVACHLIGSSCVPDPVSQPTPPAFGGGSGGSVTENECFLEGGDPISCGLYDGPNRQ